MKRKTKRTPSKERPGDSWACVLSIAAIPVGKGKGKRKRGAVVVHEAHVFSEECARILSKEWGVRFVPNYSTKRKGRVFDGRDLAKLGGKKR